MSFQWNSAQLVVNGFYGNTSFLSKHDIAYNLVRRLGSSINSLRSARLQHKLNFYDDAVAGSSHKLSLYSQNEFEYEFQTFSTVYLR